MQFIRDTVRPDTQLIRGYEPGRVTVNETPLTHSFIVASDRLVTDWPPRRFEDMTAEHLKAALALDPEILIIGTGDKQHFLSGELMGTLNCGTMGVEMMNTAAACRTYNVLLCEGRKVVAAILV